MSADSAYLERDGRHPAIAAAWRFEAEESRESLVAADGCFDLIVQVAPRGHRAAFIYTPVPAAHRVSVEAGTRMFGVRLQPGFGNAVAEHAAELRALAERVSGEGVALLDRLEGLVVSAARTVRPPDIVHEFVAQARSTAGGHRLTWSSTRAAERELQRACRRWLGLSPKAFLRIERASAVRRGIRAGAPLADVAAELGFSDQAHLTREVRQLLGVTPRELRPVANLQDPDRPRR